MAPLLQFTLVAQDQGKPQRSSDNATVTIQVTRNENAPQFERSLYVVTIPQDIRTRERVATVRADDIDARVSAVVLSTYKLIVQCRLDCLC